MGMSMHVIGIKPPDDRWNKMKGAYDACQAAGIPVPDAVLSFFEGEEPDPLGVRVDIPAYARDDYQESARDVIEVDLSKLDPDVTVLRFYNAW
jgi:hypothetical protein